MVNEFRYGTRTLSDHLRTSVVGSRASGVSDNTGTIRGHDGTVVASERGGASVAPNDEFADGDDSSYKDGRR